MYNHGPYVAITYKRLNIPHLATRMNTDSFIIAYIMGCPTSLVAAVLELP